MGPLVALEYIPVRYSHNSTVRSLLTLLAMQGTGEYTLPVYSYLDMGPWSMHR